jgi:voltage-gated potassium channel
VNPWTRLRAALAALLLVMVLGSIGYMALGFSALDAVYQTVTTVTTVGFREIEPLTATGQVFTMALILVGVGTALYTTGSLIEGLVEGHLRDVFGRRRMDRTIDRLSGHIVVCGWGRVGKAFAQYAAGAGSSVVVIDQNPLRVADAGHLTVVGDATDDNVLRQAGIERASALVAALETDAGNLYVTLSGRRLSDHLFIVSRARTVESEPKFLQAGADRVVNPQAIGGARMAAFVLQPHVAEFLDVVMHDGSLEFRLVEIPLPPGSGLLGRTLREAKLRDETGALVLAVRNPDGEFITNPDPDSAIEDGQILIAIGTAPQLEALERLTRATP